ncbi:bifunctional folylpolyglutamate synthase/dihydrofolate synthase [Sporosarcina sp. Sa2YVA2]|uniref:tetrahydrofolate synthase n=1 Tax=Sporosarcina quadrami TaxID=2762234 RepID=A0ABR8U4P7_9BACL|nr:folylpolyglutamate synthase/dihydrofolate synthase family protein [Sporosarcina quadrami]MBD7983017.1 bifunctional folylpolyglutamate synthase/dihydrofolate synthase [Sporosarcina quadrami]
MIPKFDEYKERFNIQSDDEIKPGLTSIQAALRKLGNPEQELRIIHVAGTNGKGSTIAFMENVLKEHGYTTGVFSSPAIVDVHDQIRPNGLPITSDELNNSFEQMSKAGLSGMLTDFELLTVAAFVTFERISPDYVLLECGMGGLLDSTNVVTPIVSVIPSIALDHVGFLGDDLGKIARHKAGIIKKGVPVVVGQLPEEANAVVRSKALDLNCELLQYGEDFWMRSNIFSSSELQLEIPTRRMKGPHQAMNAAIAIEALIKSGISLGHEYIIKGISEASLPYRFQEISQGVYVDGAHNPAAAKMLAETIRTEFPGEKVDFVIGMLNTKDIQATLDELIPVANSFTFVSFPHPQAAKAIDLYKSCQYNRKKMTNSYDDTILLNREVNSKKIVAGSLYLISGLLN